MYKVIEIVGDNQILRMKTYDKELAYNYYRWAASHYRNMIIEEDK